MELILMPIVVTVVGVLLFSIPALIGAAMLLGPATAQPGKRVLVYSACSLAAGLACCWSGFALMLLLGPSGGPAVRWGNLLISYPVAVFWASGPIGLVLGTILARRVLEAGR